MNRLLTAVATLRHSYSVIREGGISFSQFGEDLLVSRITSIPRDCFFVDIGAAYPVKHSNTFRLYLRGGKGLTVEPNPDLARQQRRVRPRDTCISAGVARSEGTLKYHRFAIPDYNTFHEETAERVRKMGIPTLATLDVPTLPLATLLEGHAAERTIDFMSIDCEGLDFEVLQSSDWSRFRPGVLVVEDHEWTFDAPSGSRIAQYMSNQGYSLVARLSYSSVFLREE